MNANEPRIVFAVSSRASAWRGLAWWQSISHEAGRLALEALEGVRVDEGRLSYCTATGGFTVHTIPLNELSRRRALEVLDVIDRAIEHGTLAARPADGACTRCDFPIVCGAREEDRTRRKKVPLSEDLDALRRIP